MGCPGACVGQCIVGYRDEQGKSRCGLRLVWHSLCSCLQVLKDHLSNAIGNFMTLPPVPDLIRCVQWVWRWDAQEVQECWERVCSILQAVQGRSG